MTLKNKILGLALSVPLALASGCGEENVNINVYADKIFSTSEGTSKGNVTFQESGRGKDIRYVDEGFNGTLDEVRYFNFKNRKWEKIRADSPEFENFIPEYERVKRIATYGK